MRITGARPPRGQGKARQGLARQGLARRGLARQGLARRGDTTQGKEQGKKKRRWHRETGGMSPAITDSLQSEQVL